MCQKRLHLSALPSPKIKPGYKGLFKDITEDWMTNLEAKIPESEKKWVV